METGERVLVVDDDQDIRNLIADVLSQEGYDVRTAEHGAAALGCIEQWEPDVILLDMRMPIMDGWEFVRTRRKLSGRHVPIVVMTATLNAEACAAEIAADGVLPKPFDIDELVSTVAHYLPNRVIPGSRPQ